MFDDSRPAMFAALFATSVAASVCLSPDDSPPHKAAIAREPVAEAPVLNFKTARGLKNPESALVAEDGVIYVSVIGEFAQEGDGKIVTLDEATAQPTDYVVGLNDPKGLAVTPHGLFVADVNRICRVVEPGKFEVFVSADAFEPRPNFLNDLVADPAGNLYVSDSGNGAGEGSKVYQIAPDGRVSLVIDAQSAPLAGANGLALQDPNHLLVLNFASGELLRVDLTNRQTTKINEGFQGGDGLAFDPQRRLIVTDWQSGRVWVLPTPESQSEPVGRGLFDSAADLGVTKDGRFAIVPDMRAGTVTWMPLP